MALVKDVKMDELELKTFDSPTRIPPEERLAELEEVIQSNVNRLNIDADLNLPDFIIAEYLVAELKNLALSKSSYEMWKNG